MSEEQREERTILKMNGNANIGRRERIIPDNSKVNVRQVFSGIGRAKAIVLIESSSGDVTHSEFEISKLDDLSNLLFEVYAAGDEGKNLKFIESREYHLRKDQVREASELIETLQDKE